MTNQRRHESPEVGAAVARMVRGLVRRAAEGDTEALEALARTEAVACAALTVALERAQAEAGYSFSEVAKVLGVSRQAARQRAARGPHADPSLREWLAR